MAENSPSTAPVAKRSSFGGGRKVNVRRPGVVTVVNFDAGFVHVVQASPKGEGTVITRLAWAPLALKKEEDRRDPAALGQAISHALESVRWKAGLTVMGVPREAVVVRTLSLPETRDIRELASMVQMQIGKDLPFRQEEAVIDFQVRSGLAAAGRPTPVPAAPSAPAAASAPSGTGDAKTETEPVSGTSEVLAAAVQRETVEFYQALAAAAGLKLVALGWLSHGNARAIQACGLTGSEVVALVSLRPGEVGIDIIAGEGLLFSRGAIIAQASPEEKASEDSSDEPRLTGAGTAETFVEKVGIEVVRSLHAYGGMSGQPPITKVLVTGDTGQESTVVDDLQKRLAMPCTLLEAAQALDLPSEGREHAGGAIDAIGLGLGVNDVAGLPFDFLSPKRPAVQRDMRRIRALAFTALGILVLMGLLGLRSHLINKRLKINKEVQRELAAAEKQMPTYRKVQLQAAAIQNWSKDGRNWLEQYAYLSSVLPGSEDLYITAFSVSGQGNIHLGVQARSGETLANLDRQLRAAGYEVKPLAITPGNDRYGYNFRSTVELILSPKMKIDLAKAANPGRPADDASLDPKPKRVRKGGRS